MIIFLRENVNGLSFLPVDCNLLFCEDWVKWLFILIATHCGNTFANVLNGKLTTCRHIDREKHLASMRVLLADDHLEFLAITARLLESEYEVIKMVSDGQAVVEEAAALSPDLIVLDITMPVLNGIAAARQLRAAGFMGKIIFLTIHEDPDHVRAALEAGANGFVVKSRLASDMVLGLREVIAGGLYISPNLADTNRE